MRTDAETNQTNRTIAAQLLAAKLTEPMRRALLSAQPTVGDVTWDTVSDYCPGHESLGGGSMMESVYCEPVDVCHDARVRYEADHAPDPDVLHVEVNQDHKVATVVALMARGLCLDGRAENGHKLTDLGYSVHVVLKAQKGDG